MHRALTRNAVQQVLWDLTQKRSELHKIFREKGGRYKLTMNHHTSSRFNIYTGVGFSKLTVTATPPPEERVTAHRTSEQNTGSHSMANAFSMAAS